jgi:hypothetical protein
MISLPVSAARVCNEMAAETNCFVLSSSASAAESKPSAFLYFICPFCSVYLASNAAARSGFIPDRSSRIPSAKEVFRKVLAFENQRSSPFFLAKPICRVADEEFTSFRTPCFSDPLVVRSVFASPRGYPSPSMRRVCEAAPVQRHAMRRPVGPRHHCS